MMNWKLKSIYFKIEYLNLKQKNLKIKLIFRLKVVPSRKLDLRQK